MPSITVYLNDRSYTHLLAILQKMRAERNDPSYAAGGLMSYMIQQTLRDDRTGSRIRQLLELPE